jgi:hypothetical protein
LIEKEEKDLTEKEKRRNKYDVPNGTKLSIFDRLGG